VSLYHKAALESPVLNMWNESGTNRGRIGDSAAVRLRSLRDMAWPPALHTRSGGNGQRDRLPRRPKRHFAARSWFC